MSAPLCALLLSAAVALPAGEPPTGPAAGVYQIVSQASGRHWHEDGGGDRLVSTRYQPGDDYTRFRLEPQAGGAYRIIVPVHGRHLYLDHDGDALLSTREQPDDTSARFLFDAQPDGSWRIRVQATNHVLHVDVAGDQLLSTRFQPDDGTTRFELLLQPTPVEPDGMTGHFSTGFDGSVPQPGFGMSYYTPVHVLGAQVQGMQFGWGTWILPDNRSFAGPLCFEGTVAYDSWPERGPTWWEVFHTIEGGPGRWIASRFPWSSAKFRVNAVPDCYTTQVVAPGWTFGNGLLPAGRRIGLAILSNRVLLPPDGLPFLDAARAPVAGFGWIALPLVPGGVSPESVPTGGQSWTLFLRTRNFRGPVAFFVPAFWSALHAIDATGSGRGMDAQPAYVDSIALEIGSTPMFTAEDGGGGRWRRIPRMAWPVDGSGKTVLLHDIRFYHKAAVWDGFASWAAGGAAVTDFDMDGVEAGSLAHSNMIVTLGDSEPVAFDAAFTSGTVQAADGSPAFGMQWSGGLEHGVVPEYYQQDGDVWRPVLPAAVPAETGLAAMEFPPAPQGEYPPLDLSSGSPWVPDGWSAGPCVAALADGSRVEYAWYRFVDQPAIARLGLPAGQRDALQSFVAELHAQFGLAGPSIPPPGSGTLAPLDHALLVSPPAGLETGHVPIVIAQRGGGVQREEAVFGAGMEDCRRPGP